MPPAHLTIGGVRVEVQAPDEVAARLDRLVAGPVVTVDDGEVDVHYSITREGAGRYGLERDGGGLLRRADPDAAVGALIEDLLHIVARRSPQSVVARGAVVSVAGRGVVVLGPAGAGTSTLVAALVAAGAELCSDGLAVLDEDGWAHPVTAGGPTTGSPVPVAMIVATEFVAEADWSPTEVVGVRAVLGLLGHVVGAGGNAPAARTLARRLAERVVELRGPRPEATTVAADLLARVRSLDLPARVAPRRAYQPPPAPEPRSPPVVRFEDFLDADDHARLLEFALSRAADFSPSGVHVADATPGDLHPHVRRSRSIYDLGPVWEMFESKIVKLLPFVREQLGVAWFPLGDLERHLTVHGEGDHFTLHVDDASPDTALREISAVYYFNAEPRRFTGGALRLFDTVERDGVIEPAPSHTDIEPADNRVVFFRSDTHHEVRPVHVDADDFAAQRFTIVFWARRMPLVRAVFGSDPETVTARQHQLIPALTPDGFRIVATPPRVQDRLRRLFDEQRLTAAVEPSDDTFLPTGSPSVIPVGAAGTELLAELQPIHEDWCGRELVPSAAYGIRVYGNGQTLRPHTDRVETHVISSIVHVAADVDAPWALTVQDAAGQVHDVFLEPGEMLLYESAKLPHGRPNPLHGRHYASLFLHYRPVDWADTLEELCRRAYGQMPGG